jgi:hypothetical protein
MKLTTREHRPFVSAVAIRDGQLASTGTDCKVIRFGCVEQETEPFRNCVKAASPDALFQNVASQLVAAFRVRGCALPIAEELAQKVTGEVQARVQEVLRRPGVRATWIFGVIQVGDLTLDLERHMVLAWRPRNSSFTQGI